MEEIGQNAFRRGRDWSNSFVSGQRWWKFLQERAELARILSGAIRIGQNSKFLWEWAGLVKIPLVDRIALTFSSQRKFEQSRLLLKEFSQKEIGQNSFRSDQDWPKLLWEWAGLVNIPSGASGIDQNSFRSGWDWTKLLQEWVGLDKILSGVGGIGQHSFRSRWDWSKFLGACAGVRIQKQSHTHL